MLQSRGSRRKCSIFTDRYALEFKMRRKRSLPNENVVKAEFPSVNPIERGRSFCLFTWRQIVKATGNQTAFESQNPFAVLQSAILIRVFLANYGTYQSHRRHSVQHERHAQITSRFATEKKVSQASFAVPASEASKNNFGQVTAVVQ